MKETINKNDGGYEYGEGTGINERKKIEPQISILEKIKMQKEIFQKELDISRKKNLKY